MMDTEQQRDHHEQQERGLQLQAPALLSEEAAALRPAAPRSRTLLWSVAALFIAAATVIIAFLLVNKKGEPFGEGPAALSLTHEPARADEQPEAQETSRQLSRESLQDQQQRAAAHLARARQYIRQRKWRSALFFLDQVLILNPEHADARRLLASVERKATGKTTVAAAMDLVPEDPSTPAPAPVARAAEPVPAPAPPAAVAVAKRPARPRLAMRPRAPVKARPAAPVRPAPAPEPAPAPAPSTPQVVKQAGLQVQSSPVATVYLDGIPLGQTPLKGIRLAPGIHNVKLLEEGYQAYVKEIKLEPGQERILHVKLNKHKEPKQPAAVAAAAVRPEPSPTGEPQGEPQPRPEPKPKQPAVAARTASPAPAPTPPAPTPTPAPAPTPTPTPTPPQNAGVNFLPKVVKVHAYDRDGKQTREIRMALGMVEQAAGRAAGKDASGATLEFRKFLYGAHRGTIAPITLYPRRMGLVITEALQKGQRTSSISATLIHLYRSKAFKP